MLEAAIYMGMGDLAYAADELLLHFQDVTMATAFHSHFNGDG